MVKVGRDISPGELGRGLRALLDDAERRSRIAVAAEEFARLHSFERVAEALYELATGMDSLPALTLAA